MQVVVPEKAAAVRQFIRLSVRPLPFGWPASLPPLSFQTSYPASNNCHRIVMRFVTLRALQYQQIMDLSFEMGSCVSFARLRHRPRAKVRLQAGYYSQTILHDKEFANYAESGIISTPLLPAVRQKPLLILCCYPPRYCFTYTLTSSLPDLLLGGPSLNSVVPRRA